MKNIMSACLLAIAFFSCDKRPDTSGYKLEMEDRTVMRVTGGQVIDFALKKGKLIADSINRLQTSANGILQLPAFKDSLQLKYQIELAFIDSTTAAINPKIKELLEAYQYNSENGIANEDNIQKSSSGDTLFFTRSNQINDKFAGILVLKMPKKELIKRITIKDLKKI